MPRVDQVDVGILRQRREIDIDVAGGSGAIELTVSQGGGRDVPHYHGSYDITPLPEEDQTLQTMGKMMDDNVIVREIPYFETSNPQGGVTAYIGGEW